MIFTAADVFNSIAPLAPELRPGAVDPDDIAQAFNDALLELLLEVLDSNPERLAVAITIPAAVVAVDPIDLSDDGGGTGTREWLHISYIDWRDAADEGDEVWLVPIERRNRANNDYAVFEQPIGYLDDQMRKLNKIGAFWKSVETLLVYGTLAPVKVSGQTLLDEQYEFPATLRSALRWWFVSELAPTVGIGGKLLGTWEGRKLRALERLAFDATDHVEGVIEEPPIYYET